ncbi:MAG: TetR/AcrR family transcriptional regulator [Jatrophihabitans sp.]
MSESGPQRRTQAERSEQTRAQILDAAITALTEHGYAGATTLRIQQLAGVSRGRLLYHFPSRDDLLVAAVQHLAREQMDSAIAEREWPDTTAERIDAAVETMWLAYRQPFFWAATELWLAARAHPPLREALLPAERDLGAFVRDVTDRFFGAKLVDKPGFAELREVLNTSMRGVALTYAFQPRDADTDPHLATWKELARARLAPRARVRPGGTSNGQR